MTDLAPNTASLHFARSSYGLAAHSTSLLVRFRAPEYDRPSSVGSTVLLIDASGSMAGEPIALARQAAAQVLGRLDSREQVAVVLFGSRVQVMVPMSLAPDAARALDRVTFPSLGGTNFYAGWHCAAQLLSECRRPEDGHLRVLSLTDGEFNEGVCRPADLETHLRAVAALGIQTSCLGLGRHYNQSLLLALAEAGDGVLDHASTPRDLELALSSQLGDTGALAARVLQVRLLLDGQPPVERTLAAARGGQLREALFDLQLPPSASGQQPLGTVEVRYLDALGERRLLSLPLHVERGVLGAPDPLVQHALEMRAFVEAQRESAQLAAAGELDRSVALLTGATDRLEHAGLAGTAAYIGNARYAAQALQTQGAELYTRAVISQGFNAARGRVAALAADQVTAQVAEPDAPI